MLTKDQGKELTIVSANSIWGKNIEPAFDRLVTEVYEARAFPIVTASQINAWCAKQTNNKITRIVEEDPPADTLILINAVYFNGNWTHRFNEMETTSAAASKSAPTVRSKSG